MKAIRMRVGRILPGYQKEWVLAAIPIELEDVEILQTFITNQVEWWGYGLETYLLVSYEDYDDIPKRINWWNADSLNVILNGCAPPPTVLNVDGRGHIQKM